MSPFDAPFDSQKQISPEDFLRSGKLRGFDSVRMEGARSRIVNRTHRVVREQALVLQARRSRVRSLALPLLICSTLLILACLAVWSGLYEYEQFEAAQSGTESAQSESAAAELSSAVSAETSNHLLVVLLWFVPVSTAVLTTVWFRRSRRDSDGWETDGRNPVGRNPEAL